MKAISSTHIPSGFCSSHSYVCLQMLWMTLVIVTLWKRGYSQYCKTTVMPVSKHYIFVGHIFTNCTSGNTFWCTCIGYCFTQQAIVWPLLKLLQLFNFIKIHTIEGYLCFSSPQNCEIQQGDKTNWKKRKTKCGKCFPQWCRTFAVQSILSSQPFHSQLFAAQNANIGFLLYYGIQTTTSFLQYSDSIMYNTYIASWCMKLASWCYIVILWISM